MKRALLIIDVQNDYFEGGKLLVIHVQHINEPNDIFLLPDTDGVKIHHQLTPLNNK